MALLNQAFNAAEVEPAQALDPIPPGWYTGQVEQSEIKPTASGNGSYLQLSIKILAGQHAGRTVFERLNLDNPNPTAVDIARRSLSAICRAVGIEQLADSEDLHNRPLELKIAIRPAKGEYAANNDIKGYRKSTDAPILIQTGAPAQSAAPANPSAAPWES